MTTKNDTTPEHAKHWQALWKSLCQHVMKYPLDKQNQKLICLDCGKIFEWPWPQQQ